MENIDKAIDVIDNKVWTIFSQRLISGVSHTKAKAIEEHYGTEFIWERHASGRYSLRILGFINGFLAKHGTDILARDTCEIDRLIRDFRLVSHVKFGLTSEQSSRGMILVTREQLDHDVDEIIASEG